MLEELIVRAIRDDRPLCHLLQRVAAYYPLGFRVHPDVGTADPMLREISTEDLELLVNEAGRLLVPGELPLGHILWRAHENEVTLSEVLRSYKRLDVLGYKLPAEAEHLGLLDWTEDDLRVLSLDGDGQPPWRSRKVTGVDLLGLAMVLRRQPEDIAARLEYLFGGRLTLDSCPDDLTRYRLSSTDVEILRSATLMYRADEKPRWTKRFRIRSLRWVRLSALVDIAKGLNVSMRDVAHALRAAEAFGVDVGWDTVALGFVSADDPDLALLPRDEVWGLGRHISLADVIETAKRVDLTPADVVRRLEKFARVGVVLPCPSDRLDDVDFDELDAKIVRHMPDRNRMWRNKVSKVDVGAISALLQVHRGEVERRVDKIRSLGIIDEDVALPREERRLRPGLSKLSHVLYGAMSSQEPIGRVISRIDVAADVGTEVTEAISRLPRFVPDEVDIIVVESFLRNWLPDEARHEALFRAWWVAEDEIQMRIRRWEPVIEAAAAVRDGERSGTGEAGVQRLWLELEYEEMQDTFRTIGEDEE